MFVMRSGSGATDSTVLRVVHATDVGVTVAAAELTAIQTAVEIMDDWDETNRAAVNVISGQAAVAADEGEADARTVRVVHAGDVGVTVAAAELTAIQTAVEIMDDWDETDRAKVNLITSQAGIAADEGEADGRTVRVVHAGDVGVTVAASELTAIQTAVQIMDDWDAVHDSAAVSDGPQIMAEARTTNPTAVDNGDAVRPRADDLGRLVTRPHQARDLMATAYVSLSNGTETTLLSGAASTLHDLIYVTCANQSDAATYVDFRCGTAGSVVLTVEIPAEATAGVALPSPIPMPEVAQAWTVDMPDITGTTIDISALFSKEV